MKPVMDGNNTTTFDQNILYGSITLGMWNMIAQAPARYMEFNAIAWNFFHVGLKSFRKKNTNISHEMKRQQKRMKIPFQQRYKDSIKFLNEKKISNFFFGMSWMILQLDLLHGYGCKRLRKRVRSAVFNEHLLNQRISTVFHAPKHLWKKIFKFHSLCCAVLCGVVLWKKATRIYVRNALILTVSKPQNHVNPT